MIKLLQILGEFLRSLWSWWKTRKVEQETEIQKAAADLSEQQRQEEAKLHEQDEELEAAVKHEQQETEAKFGTDESGSEAVAGSLNDFFRVRNSSEPNDQ